MIPYRGLSIRLLRMLPCAIKGPTVRLRGKEKLKKDGRTNEKKLSLHSTQLLVYVKKMKKITSKKVNNAIYPTLVKQ